MNERERKETQIFSDALEFSSAAERTDYLNQACADDAALRQRVEALLRVRAEADQYFGSVTTDRNRAVLSGIACSSDAGNTVPLAGLTEKTGVCIDGYKLLEKIGEGGCGVVYMAEQKEPIKRRVALKIIKIGMDTREVVARFEAERQALAIMDHPNIAKIFAAGATDSSVSRAGETANRRTGDSPTPPFADTPSQLKAGRPYFVMELVRGVNITDYCDQKNLSTRERLDLFMLVCQAVQHAHQKGIIHRDLKPSNILVTVNDGVAVPKIIDFGIAKATQMELTEKTVFTRFQQFLGTPAYMSPEQAELTSVDIDTRSDIYSLGVLLYELLTGKTPFDAKELLKAGLDEMRRTIREKEPERPSTRVSTLRGEELTTTAKRRGLQPPKLINLLRGDLDWIVMKCLEKDRARRYETAYGLASDIHRHLNNEPVVACPPSNLYRFQKLVRRNKLAFAAAGGIAAALVIGLAIALWQSVEKTRAYNRAVTAEEAAKAEAKILKDMLESAGPEITKGRDATIVLEMLDKTSERIEKELGSYPEVEMDLSGTIGSLYRNLGHFQKAEKFLRRALALREQNHPTANNADVLWMLGAVLFEQGKLQESEEFLRKALAAQRKFGREDANATDFLGNLAEQFGNQGKLSEAKLLATEALTLSRKLFGATHERVAWVLEKVAAVEDAGREFRDAEEHQQEAIAIWEKLGGHEYELHFARANLAATLTEEGKLQEAESLCDEGLAFMRKLYGNDHPAVAGLLQNLAKNLGEQGRLLEAEYLYREAVEIERKRFSNENPRILGSLIMLGVVLAREDKLREATPVFSEAVDLCRKNPEWGLQPQNFAYHHLGKVLADQGELVKAEAVQSEHLAFLRKRGPTNWFVMEALAELAITLMAEHKFAQAEPLLRESLTLRDPEAWSAFSTRILLGECLLNQKRFGEAEPLLIAGYEGVKQRSEVGWKARFHRRHPGERRALELLARLYAETGRPERAAEWRQKLAEFEKTEAHAKNLQSGE